MEAMWKLERTNYKAMSQKEQLQLRCRIRENRKNLYLERKCRRLNIRFVIATIIMILSGIILSVSTGSMISIVFAAISLLFWCFSWFARIVYCPHCGNLGFRVSLFEERETNCILCGKYLGYSKELHEIEEQLKAEGIEIEG